MDETEGEEKKKERKEGRTAAGLELRIEWQFLVRVAIALYCAILLGLLLS